MSHTVEKIGGTSMSQYAAVRDNIILGHNNKLPVVGRIMVVSAYGGITDLLLEHKKTGRLGVYGLFAANEDGQSWREAMDVVREQMLATAGFKERVGERRRWLDRSGAAADRLLGGEGQSLHLLGGRKQPPARLGQRVARRATVEQSGLEPMLERAEAPRQRSVVDLQSLRRGGQPAASRDREKGAQVVPVEARHGDFRTAVAAQSQ